MIKDLQRQLEQRSKVTADGKSEEDKVSRTVVHGSNHRVETDKKIRRSLRIVATLRIWNASSNLWHRHTMIWRAGYN